MSKDQYKFLLNEQDLPKQWYNIRADMPMPTPPVLNPHTKEPITAEFLNVLFPMSLIEQEMSTERYIDIPEEVREIYKLWRRALDSGSPIGKNVGYASTCYYKNEVLRFLAVTNATQLSLRLITINQRRKSLTTETGAGQWGSALPIACKFFDMDLEVYMVKASL